MELQAERRALQPAPIERRLRRLREIWDRDWIEVEATPDAATRAIKVYTELAGDMPEQRTAVQIEGELMHVLAALKPTLGLPSEYLPKLPTSPTPTPEAPP